jgi:hypothetical protein
MGFGLLTALSVDDVPHMLNVLRMDTEVMLIESTNTFGYGLLTN